MAIPIIRLKLYTWWFTMFLFLTINYHINSSIFFYSETDKSSYKYLLLYYNILHVVIFISWRIYKKWCHWNVEIIAIFLHHLTSFFFLLRPSRVYFLLVPRFCLRVGLVYYFRSQYFSDKMRVAAFPDVIQE